MISYLGSNDRTVQPTLIETPSSKLKSLLILKKDIFYIINLCENHTKSDKENTRQQKMKTLRLLAAKQSKVIDGTNPKALYTCAHVQKEFIFWKGFETSLRLSRDGENS